MKNYGQHTYSNKDADRIFTIAANTTQETVRRTQQLQGVIDPSTLGWITDTLEDVQHRILEAQDKWRNKQGYQPPENHLAVG